MPALRKRSSSDAAAALHSAVQAFSHPRRRSAASGLESGVAELLADRDEFGNQAPQAPALGDLGTGLRERVRRNAAGAGLAGDLGGEDPLRAVAARSAAGAAGAPALLEALDERAGAQVAELGELLEQRLAARLQGRIAQRVGQGLRAGGIAYFPHGGLATMCIKALPSQFPKYQNRDVHRGLQRFDFLANAVME